MPSFANTLRRCHSTGARTDEEPRTDLGIGEAATGEASDLGILER